MRKKAMRKQAAGLVLAAIMGAVFLAGCKEKGTGETNEGSSLSVGAENEVSAETDKPFEETTVTIYAAASLETVLTELIQIYQEGQPNVTIQGSYDSSGTLLTQIEEADGNGIDIFFSAGQSQMDTLEQEDGLVVEGTRHNVVNNQVCVVTYPGSGTKVTGLANIGEASSLALADGSVPVGRYTRQALIHAGMLQGDDPAAITTEQVSQALGGVVINECGNVSKVLQAVAEHSNEVGTTYYSDTYGYEEDVQILEVIPYELTGDVIYPIAQVTNGEADELQAEAAEDFLRFLISDAAKPVFEKYYFDTDVTD